MFLSNCLEEPSPNVYLSQTSLSTVSIDFYKPSKGSQDFYPCFIVLMEIKEEGIYFFLAMGT